MKGTTIQSQDNMNSAVRKIIISFVEKKYYDAVLMPKRISSGESFASELINNVKSLNDCTPLPPIIPIHGARVLKQLTRKGPLSLKILCVMRPCEIRASVELAKLRQVNLDNITFLSLDCPGAFPTKKYISDPVKYDESFEQALKTFQADDLRVNCTTCTHFDNFETPTDLHIAKIGLPENTLKIIPFSEKGEQSIKAIELILNADISEWQTKTKERRQNQEENRKTAFSAIVNKVTGIDNLAIFFADCINCHNCMRVCPICYCRQCFFDSSDAIRVEPENYLMRANKKGGIAFPTDTLLFHLGRMSHMNLSCVGCGACEDACAMSVPVSQIFNFLGKKVQEMFNYVPGKDKSEPIPVLIYSEDELHEYEDAKETA